jgi:hypothetical protein
MVREVIEHVAQRDVTWRFGYHPTSGAQLPVGRQQRVVRGALERRARIAHALIVRRDQFRLRRELHTRASGGFVRIEFILLDDEGDPRWHRRDHAREASSAIDCRAASSRRVRPVRFPGRASCARLHGRVRRGVVL